jgi:hypothetical protein
MFVILDYDLKPKIKFRGWPELVGTDGDDAVNIIKQETGEFVGIYENDLIEFVL